MKAYYPTLNINQKINAKANVLVTFGKEHTGKLMRQAKKDWVSCPDSSRLKLESDGINSNRHYDV